jgi:protein-disulfide isomerase
MHFSNLLLAAAALAAAGCGQPKSEAGQPVARIGDQTITWSDLNKAYQELNKDATSDLDTQLTQMQMQHEAQVYQAKRQALDAMIMKRVLDAKAKQAGVASAEELMQKQQADIMAKIPDPPDAELQAVYDQAKAAGQQLPPFDQVKPDIIRFVKSQKARTELMSYFEGVKKEQKVKVLMLPPRYEVEAKGPTKGSKNAPITIVEYSDYQCPFCIDAEKTVSELLKAYPDKIRLVYRDFPLPMHPLAPKAAEASHCADAQGKYWELHDKMFAAQGKLEVPDLKKYAREVQGLDGDKFDKCLDGGDMKKLVDENHVAGEKMGISGTPAFFVNGRFLSGALPIDEFKTLIDADLAAR